jgi:hypothetical protein
MKKTVILFWFLFGTVVVQAQSISFLMGEAQYYFEEADYFSAAYYYEQILEQDSAKTGLWYKYAQSLRLTNQFAESSYYYNKVWQVDQGKKYPKTLLWLGMTSKNLGNYQQASDFLKAYIESHPDPSDFWHRKALLELKGSDYALQLEADQTIIGHLSYKVNSKVSDFSAFPLGDSLLYFSSMVKSETIDNEKTIGHQSKVYLSKRLNIANEFRFLNNPDFHAANVSFREDGLQLFFNLCKTQEKQQLNCQIYTSYFKDGLWSNPVLMGSKFNFGNSNNTHPKWAIWNGIEGLFISSDRPGGKGQLDIWFVAMQGLAIPLANGINTSGNEITPFYHTQEKKLYFSSDFHAGIGGYDIFEASWNNKWGLVTNVGKPLNSSHNDLYYVSRADSANLGYLTSNRKGSMYIHKESCCNDIYSFEKVPVCICVRQDSLFQQIDLNLPLSLYFHNDEPNPNTTDSTTELSYAQAYASFYSMKSKYVLKFGEVLSGRLKSEAENRMANFFEQEVSQGYSQLQKLAVQLELAMDIGAQISINVKGFTSPLTNAAYNQMLSKRRISSVLNYLQNYQDGALSAFIANGDIEINELSLGESNVDAGVSDNPNDKRKSVYSISASKERRIDIQSIRIEWK